MRLFKNRPKFGSTYMINIIHNVGKVAQKCGLFCDFQKKTVQNKQSRIGRKFAKSGHPGSNLPTVHCKKCISIVKILSTYVGKQYYSLVTVD
jgi:hypothetical protein